MALPLHRAMSKASGDANLIRSRTSGSQTRPSGDMGPHASGTSPTLPIDKESDQESNALVRASVEHEPQGLKRFIRRFRGEGRRNPTWKESLYALATCSSTFRRSWLHVLWFLLTLCCLLSLEHMVGHDPDILGWSFCTLGLRARVHM